MPTTTPEVDDMNRDVVIVRIRRALKARSGRAWSVTGGHGTAWGWIRISVPPAQRVDGTMTPDQCAELARLLGLERVHCQGESIPAAYDYRREYIDRAEGRVPNTCGKPYWD